LSFRIQNVLDADFVPSTLPNEITNSLIRMKVLTILYFPSLTSSVEELSDLLRKLWGTFKLGTHVDKPTKETILAKDAYTKSYKKWMEKLQGYSPTNW
jgi:hypothetical protein